MQGKSSTQLHLATFGGGCFWCTEAIFQRLKGVHSVVSGYAGGKRQNPSYDQVSTGATGHAEVIQLQFDPEQISYQTLLDIFWHTHNPTELNRQGADVGTQYRSVIFYHTAEQQQHAEQMKQELAHSDEFEKPIVTEIIPFTSFYPAEEYHQNYYQNNPQLPYCSIVIQPKLQKLIKMYSQELK